jgi:hypothetical protein
MFSRKTEKVCKKSLIQLPCLPIFLPERSRNNQIVIIFSTIQDRKLASNSTQQKNIAQAKKETKKEL